MFNYAKVCVIIALVAVELGFILPWLFQAKSDAALLFAFILICATPVVLLVFLKQVFKDICSTIEHIGD